MMKSGYFLNRFFLLVSGFLFAALTGIAQIPECTDIEGEIYFDDGKNIYNYNPQKPTSATNPKKNNLPFKGVGLALGPNINTGSAANTFYTVINMDNDTAMYYHYYEGGKWINTGHKASSVNLGAGGGYVYNIRGGTGDVFVYDGKGNDKWLMKPAQATSVAYDIIADAEGNFYILNTGVRDADRWVRKYNPQGILLQQWLAEGIAGITVGGGFAIIDNTVYFDGFRGGPANGIFVYKGKVCGKTIQFEVADSLPLLPNQLVQDFANCPKPLYSEVNDTICYEKGIPVKIKSGGAAPYTFTVLNGTAQISGYGPEFTVSPKSPAVTILLNSVNPCKDAFTDTFTLLGHPTVKIGQDFTILGCLHFKDTLHAVLTDTVSWLNYSIKWNPEEVITSGLTTLEPVIEPKGNTTFKLEVTMPQCGTSTDSISVSVADKSVKASFSYLLHLGCAADTLICKNTSLENTYSSWHFGDRTVDTTSNPAHIYPQQSQYTVTLKAGNEWCSDSSSQNVDTRHPLIADFSPDRDTICQGDKVEFTYTGIATLLPIRYQWNFGNGHQDTIRNPGHLYSSAGQHKVMLVITDSLLCKDTVFYSIVVDSMPTLISYDINPKELCTGQAIHVEATYTSMGNTGTEWNFGHGTPVLDLNEGSFAYDQEGIYEVIFHAAYRACKDIRTIDTVHVSALPLVRLLPDTSLCLNGNVLWLSNLESALPGYQYVWSSGDTTATIAIRQPGEYSLSVKNEKGCIQTETIKVLKDCYLDIPNVFTPNGDGKNDYFFPRRLSTLNFTQFRMQLFNRWGQIVFQTMQFDELGWDGQFNGTAQPQDVYIYNIEAEIDGIKQERYQGNVTLIR